MDKINSDWAKEVPCRNIIIYGFCKKKDEGCPFKHEEDEPEVTNRASTQAAISPEGAAGTPVSVGAKSYTPKFNAKASASFTPMSKTDLNPEMTSSGFLENSIPGSPVPMMKASTPVAFMAPQVYGSSTPVPSQGPMMIPNNGQAQHMDRDNGQPSVAGTGNMVMDNSSFQPSPPPQPPLQQQQQQQQPPPHFQDRPSVLMRDSSLPMGMVPGGLQPMSNMKMPGPPQSAGVGGGGIMQPMNGAGNTVDLGSLRAMNFRYPAIYPPSHSILQYHLYAPDPPPQLESALKKNERTARMLFIPNDLREELVKRNLASLQLFPSGAALPDVVQDYFGLVPLDFHQKSNQATDRYRGHSNSLFKVFSNVDGNLYLLRRIHGLRVDDAAAVAAAFQRWAQVDSANVVAVKDLFVTTAFGDTSVCVVSEYYPNATSLHETHFSAFANVPLTEDLLWSYAVQLLNGLRAVVAAAGSQRCPVQLDLDKVLVTGRGRVKITLAPERDLLGPNDKAPNALRSLGDVLFRLARRMTNHQCESPESLPLVSAAFKQLVAALLRGGEEHTEISEVVHRYIGYDRLCAVHEAEQTLVEHTENVLLRELENGRLFRLVCKLNFIFGRAENRLDINWAESGDKFAIVLFYDYVFHQVAPDGRPVTDLTHVLRCLNKLDAGVQENVLLVTPDELNSIVVSYRRLKEQVDRTFRAMTI